MYIYPLIFQSIADESDRAFMEHVFIHYRGIMYFQAYAMTQSDLDAEDLIAECWIALCKHVQKLKELEFKSEGDLKRYLVRCVRNNAINLGKKKGRKREVFLERYEELVDAVESEGPTTEEQVVSLTQLEDLRKALRVMPRQYYDVLQMKYTDDMKDEEIAKRIGISKASVTAYVSTARRMAKDILIERGSDLHA